VEAETADVFAAVDYLRTLPFADTKRIGIMGYSLGGAVTMFAAYDGFPVGRYKS
jgi:dienelactone hydrolase